MTPAQRTDPVNQPHPQGSQVAQLQGAKAAGTDGEPMDLECGHGALGSGTTTSGTAHQHHPHPHPIKSTDSQSATMGSSSSGIGSSHASAASLGAGTGTGTVGTSVVMGMEGLGKRVSESGGHTSELSLEELSISSRQQQLQQQQGLGLGHHAQGPLGAKPGAPHPHIHSHSHASLGSPPAISSLVSGPLSASASASLGSPPAAMSLASGPLASMGSPLSGPSGVGGIGGVVGGGERRPRKRKLLEDVESGKTLLLDAYRVWQQGQKVMTYDLGRIEKIMSETYMLIKQVDEDVALDQAVKFCQIQMAASAQRQGSGDAPMTPKFSKEHRDIFFPSGFPTPPCPSVLHHGPHTPTTPGLLPSLECPPADAKQGKVPRMAHTHTHAHGHTHAHAHSHGHSHGHSHVHGHAHTHPHLHSHAHPHSHAPPHAHQHAHSHSLPHCHHQPHTPNQAAAPALYTPVPTSLDQSQQSQQQPQQQQQQQSLPRKQQATVVSASNMAASFHQHGGEECVSEGLAYRQQESHLCRQMKMASVSQAHNAATWGSNETPTCSASQPTTDEPCASGESSQHQQHPQCADPSRMRSRIPPNMPKLFIPSAVAKFPPEITVTPPTPTLLSPRTSSTPTMLSPTKTPGGSISQETKQRLKNVILASQSAANVKKDTLPQPALEVQETSSQESSLESETEDEEEEDEMDI